MKPHGCCRATSLGKVLWPSSDFVPCRCSMKALRLNFVAKKARRQAGGVGVRIFQVLHAKRDN
jgi:hypothetical protein